MESVQNYCYDVPADSYDVNIPEIIDGCKYQDKDGWKLDTAEAISSIEDSIKDMVVDDLEYILADLPADINVGDVIYSRVDITIDGAEVLLERFYEPDYEGFDDYSYDHYRDGQDKSLLDDIFNRKIE